MEIANMLMEIWTLLYEIKSFFYIYLIWYSYCNAIAMSQNTEIHLFLMKNHATIWVEQPDTDNYVCTVFSLIYLNENNLPCELVEHYHSHSLKIVVDWRIIE